MKTLLLALMVFGAVGCGSEPLTKEDLSGSWHVTMDFQVARGLVGTAAMAGGDGTWTAYNAENTYAGHVVSGDNGSLVFWFGDVGQSFQLRTVAHFEGDTLVAGSIDPAIDSTIYLRR
jgi:hypothetical protein